MTDNEETTQPKTVQLTGSFIVSRAMLARDGFDAVNEELKKIGKLKAQELGEEFLGMDVEYSELESGGYLYAWAVNLAN